jgi:hypothetical protein
MEGRSGVPDFRVEVRAGRTGRERKRAERGAGRRSGKRREECGSVRQRRMEGKENGLNGRRDWKR